MMDTRTAVLDGIKDRLCAYAARVSVEQGKLSDSAEEFYRELLDLMLGCQLKNMNRERANFPGIDLGDDSEAVKLGVQVTSTGTHAKVKHTLEEFFANGLHERFDRLIVLVIGRADRLDKKLPKQEGFDFQVSRDVWDTAGLIRRIEELDDDRLEQVAAFLTKRVSFRRRERVLNLPIQGAMGDKDFVGRQEELRRMDRELAQEGIAVLSGLGGMGKTELALKWGRDYRLGNVYFVRFSTSLRRTLLEQIVPYIPGLSREGQTEEQLYGEAMAALERCDPLDVLILDNADRAEQSMDQLCRELRGLPLRVLVTTRLEHKGAIWVDRLEKEQLYEIFRGHGVERAEPELDVLIDAVDGHTLTVDLMARLLRRERRSDAYPELRDALTKRDLDHADLGSVGADYSGTEGQARINEHLRAVFRVAKLGTAEQTLLRFAALLPDCGLDADLFADAAVQKKQEKKRGFLARLFRKPEEPPILQTPRKVRDVLQSLADGGWLEWQGDLLKIHPVICIVCREELKPTEETCGAFVTGVWGWYDQKKYDHVRYSQMAELFAAADAVLDDPSGWYICLAGFLWIQLGDARQALVCNLRAVELYEQSQPDSNNLATAYNNVGLTYGDLGDHKRALEYKLKALTIREKVLPPEHPDLASSYNNVGYTYGQMGDHKRALEYKLKALTIREKILPPEHPDLAQSYNNVGSTYYYMGNNEKNLEYQLKALTIREKVLPPDHPDLAQSYNNVGCTYGQMGDQEKKLEYYLKALSIREKVLPPTHPDLAQSCNNVALTYYEMGEYDTALEYMRRAVDIVVQSLPEGHPRRVNYCRWAERMEREASQRRDAE